MNTRELIIKYFEGIKFNKHSNTEKYVGYYALISNKIAPGQRGDYKNYIIAFVPNHLAILDNVELSELQFENIQTRLIKGDTFIPKQNWTINRKLENPIFTLEERLSDRSRFRTPDGNEVILLHDKSKKTNIQYHSHINMIAALLTWRFVMTFKLTPSINIQAINFTL